MSKGSRMVGVRLEPWLEARIMETIERNNNFTRGEPWTISTWIRDAMLAKIAHQDRARVQRAKRGLAARRRAARPALPIPG